MPGRGHASALHEAIASYLGAGFSVVPLPAGAKSPRIKGWQTQTFGAADFPLNANVALRLDNGLVDLDLDWPEARQLAHALLPPSATFGRASASPSHMLFDCRDLSKPRKFVLPASVATHPLFAGREHALTVVELRTGKQATMVPPSVHPSGEVVGWIGEPRLTRIDGAELHRAAGLLATLAVVVRCYSAAAGTRNDVCLALSGGLIRAGCPANEAVRLTQLVAHLAGDEEADERGAGEATEKKLAEGGEVVGLPRLCELLGLPADMVGVFGRWLGSPVDSTSGHAPPDGAILIDSAPSALDAMDRAFAASSLPHYQRAGRRVHVTREGSVEGEPPGPHRISECVPRVIQQDIARIAKLVRWDARSRRYVETKCPDDLAQMYLSKTDGWAVPELRGVIEAPTLRPDGSVLQTPGYDKSTGYLYAPRIPYPEIPEHPDRDAAETALRELEHVVRDFPFASAADRSVWLAGVLTSVARPAMETAPIFGFDASQFGAGKSKLASLVHLIATGRRPVMKGWARDEAENEKRLFSALSAGDDFYIADNVERGLPFGGEAIAAILTADQWSARELGKSRQPTVSTRAMFMATGVNLTFTADMVRRALRCRLESNIERPQDRAFDYDIEADTQRDHPRLLVAGLTVLRAYAAAGYPMHGASKPLGSFADFDRLVRGALIGLGRVDPVETQREIEVLDPELDTLGRCLELLATVFGDRPFQLREIGMDPSQQPLVEWANEIAPSRDGRVNTKAVGKYFARCCGTPTGGRRLTRVKPGAIFAAGKRARDGIIWRVEKLSGLPQDLQGEG